MSDDERCFLTDRPDHLQMSAIDPSLLFSQPLRSVGSSGAASGVNGVNVSSSHRQTNGHLEDPTPEDIKPSASSMRQAEADSDSVMARDVLPNGDDLGAATPIHNIDANDVTLAAFLSRLDEYEPVLPDAVTRYYLERAGFDCADDRV